MLQETLSSQLGVLEEEFQLEGRLSQVRQGRKSLCVWHHSVFRVLECCTGFGIEPIHHARATKLGRGWLPAPILRLLSNLPFTIA